MTSCTESEKSREWDARTSETKSAKHVSVDNCMAVSSPAAKSEHDELCNVERYSRQGSLSQSGTPLTDNGRTIKSCSFFSINNFFLISQFLKRSHGDSSMLDWCNWALTVSNTRTHSHYIWHVTARRNHVPDQITSGRLHRYTSTVSGVGSASLVISMIDYTYYRSPASPSIGCRPTRLAC